MLLPFIPCKKIKDTIRYPLFFGGEGEIRTLEPLLTVTRFPVVRPRPTRRLLLVCSTRLLYHIFSIKSIGRRIYFSKKQKNLFIRQFQVSKMREKQDFLISQTHPWQKQKRKKFFQNPNTKVRTKHRLLKFYLPALPKGLFRR